MRQSQKLQELGIVVEHLLEMRHQPALVDRVAREPAAEVIVDAALADALERDLDRREIALLAGALPCPPQEFEQHAVREFRRAAQAAMHGIDQAAELLRSAVELSRPDDDHALRRGGLRQPFHERAAIMLDALRLLAEHARDLAQYVDERRLAITAGLREIRAAPERLALRRQEHCERPAAMLAHQVQRRHVDLVDVGTLLAVDFDVDEEVVHYCRSGVVLEALVRHHMAPVTGGIADREQDRLVGALGLFQRRRVPRPPIDRIVLMLQEIGRGFLRQAVLVGRCCGRCHKAIMPVMTDRSNDPAGQTGVPESFRPGIEDLIIVPLVAVTFAIWRILRRVFFILIDIIDFLFPILLQVMRFPLFTLRILGDGIAALLKGIIRFLPVGGERRTAWREVISRHWAWLRQKFSYKAFEEWLHHAFENGMAWVFKTCREMTPRAAMLVIVGAVLWLPISFTIATVMHAVLIAKATSLPAWMQLLHPIATVIAKSKLLVLPVYPAAWPQAKQHPLVQALIRFWRYLMDHYVIRKIGYRYRQAEEGAAEAGDALRHTAAATGLSRLGN